MTCTIDLLSPSRVIRSAEQRATRTELVKGATNEAEDKILRVLRTGTVVYSVSDMASLTGLTLKSTEINMKRLIGRNLARIANSTFGSSFYEAVGPY